MAITKIHPIRRTLKNAVNYIINEKKTDEALLVSSFGCSPENASEEFALTRSYSNSKSPITAQHLIQSFAKGEVTPEEAHAIGKELANRFTEGKHEYIIATHIDKGHIHNHIIFNHISFTDHLCFHANSRKNHQLRELSDEICEEHGLSVIKNPKSKDKTYYEWSMSKQGKSYKKKLRDNIDKLIPEVSSYDELISKLQELGYEVKRGKYDSFRVSDQERFTRSKTIGPDYTKEAISKRIEQAKTGTYYTPVNKPTFIRIWKYDQNLGLIENTGNYLIYIQGVYARQSAAIVDAKKIAATYNLLMEKGIDSVEKLNEVINESNSAVLERKASIKQIEAKISDINDTIKYAERVDKNRSTYQKYIQLGKPSDFYDKYRAEIMLYESAIMALKKKDIQDTLLSDLKEQREELRDQKLDLSASLEELKKEHEDLITAKKNVEIIMDEKEEEKEKNRNITLE